MKVKSIELLYGEKTWVQVIFDNGTVWIPSFEQYCQWKKIPQNKIGEYPTLARK